jgi:cytochrome c peroxidase
MIAVRGLVSTSCCAAGFVLAAVGCSEPSHTDAHAVATQTPHAMLEREPLEPLPEPPPADGRVVALGRKLFHDRRLSADDSTACSSCHSLENGGVDGKPKSTGIHGSVGNVNAPTVYNSGLNFLQFWDGRARSLEEQVGGPLTNPLEMGSSWEQALAKIGSDSDYRSRFAAVYADGVTENNVRGAIATFERALVTSGSPFDRWLGGDKDALSERARSGYELFKSVGCIACHQGRNVGGNMLQRFGVFGDYFADRGSITEADYGRFNVTHNEADRFVFRVPSLRFVAKTAPYFHDGSADTLTRAVQVMAKYQLGRTLTDEQVGSIVAFLGSLAGPTPSAVAEN